MSVVTAEKVTLVAHSDTTLYDALVIDLSIADGSLRRIVVDGKTLEMVSNRRLQDEPWEPGQGGQSQMRAFGLTA